MMRRIFSETAIIIFVSVSLSLGVNGFRSHGIRLFRSETDIIDIKDMAQELSFEEGIDKNEMFFAGSGPVYDHSKGHVRKVSNLPENSFENWMGDFISETPYISTDSIYCNLPVNLAEKFYGANFSNACFHEKQHFYYETGRP
ncbi:MAG: hypothetical protein GY749_13075 [Desulfobacteraceae bacterium]|nr:hypothetical protein [Desulfobacteraceae bacterium]